MEFLSASSKQLKLYLAKTVSCTEKTDFFLEIREISEIDATILFSQFWAEQR